MTADGNRLVQIYTKQNKKARFIKFTLISLILPSVKSY